jgi:hypothetical protein
LRAQEAFESLKASLRTRMEHARRFPEAKRAVFEDLDFLLRVRHRIEEREERKNLIGRMAELC